MKFHKSLVTAVVETLQQIFEEHVYADKAVEHVLKTNPKWGARDRRFIAETTYGMVRWWRWVVEVLGEKEGVGQVYYFKLFAVWQLLAGHELPDWEEFSTLNKELILKRSETLGGIRKFREAFPDWLDDLCSKELGEDVWNKESAELNKEADVVIRVNTTKISAKELEKKLIKQGVELNAIAVTDAGWSTINVNAFVVKRQRLQSLVEYQQGLFEIQDASSQLVAPFLRVEPGMTVIDACAGAGGKSLHIAAMMNNKGKILSMDVEERKLKELERRAQRAGVTIIQTQVINASTIAKLKNTADRLLLDVPCSGLGVLRRNPDAKWKLNLDFVEEIKKAQQEIISNYSQLLKPGGIMVYATCSILPSENQLQVEQFLAKNKNTFEFIEDRKVLPSEGFDGFYMAAIRKLSVNVGERVI